MSFLIDGYNFLFRIEGLKKGSLEKKRKAFIEILDKQLEHFTSHTFFVIFDSAQQLCDYAQCSHCSHLDVLYAPKGQSADEYIIELVEISRNPKTVTVITSDSSLARDCKHLGAKTLTIEEFVTLIVKKANRKIHRTSSFVETPFEMERLLKAFEERLKNF